MAGPRRPVALRTQSDATPHLVAFETSTESAVNRLTLLLFFNELSAANETVGKSNFAAVEVQRHAGILGTLGPPANAAEREELTASVSLLAELSAAVKLP